MAVSDQFVSKQYVKKAAIELGFDAVGFTSPDAVPLAPERLQSFLHAGRHGEMHWLEERAVQRSAPHALWPAVNSVIVVGQNYGPSSNPLNDLNQKSTGNISVYARNKDYHDVVKKRLKALARKIVEEFGGELKVFVDTAPVMEKPLAARAGLGWQGKHTNLVSRGFGSWLFLGVIYTTLSFEPDKAEQDHCGSCRECLDICPTKAFPAPYQLDARRCISYLTIEHKGPIPEEFRAHMGNRIYGCDDCLAICPWNKFAQTTREAKLQARAELQQPSLEMLAMLDDASFRAFFSGSPVKRTGRDRFVRNVMIAIGNSKDDNLKSVVHDRLTDTAPLVRGAAIWAARKLFTEDEWQAAKRVGFPDPDESVNREWLA